MSSPSIVVDSGLLEVSRYFGLNIHSKENVKFRRRTECTVPPTDGYIRFVSRSELGNDPAFFWPPPYNIQSES